MKSQNIALSRIKNLIRAVRKELLHFVFPAFCIHCQKVGLEAPELFCSDCQELIQRFPLDECEPYKAIAVEKEGVAKSLLKEVHGSASQEVISTMAALMAIQMIDLKWPIPDIIIPSPKNPINFALSEELSVLLQVPVKKWLKTETEWKSPGICSDRNLLVVDLALSFSDSFKILEESAPSKIFQIGFCFSSLS